MGERKLNWEKKVGDKNENEKRMKRRLQWQLWLAVTQPNGIGVGKWNFIYMRRQSFWLCTNERLILCYHRVYVYIHWWRRRRWRLRWKNWLDVHIFARWLSHSREIRYCFYKISSIIRTNCMKLMSINAAECLWNNDFIKFV